MIKRTIWHQENVGAKLSVLLSRCQIVRCQIVLVPNCSLLLSWCQIVLVPNCPGAILSTFIILVPNCLLLLSWCQIVPFIILVPNCPVPNCPVPNCPTIKIRYHIFHFKHIHPQNEKQKKKRSFILMRTQIGFNLKCIAQCICSKSSGLTFLDNVWFGMFERSLRPVLRVADSP